MSRRRTRARTEIQAGSGNVYADLGYPDAGAMLLKAHLVSKIAEIIERKGLMQTEAAAILGLTQPRVSALLRGQFRGVSERRLLECLTSLGCDVQIVVRESPQGRSGGKLTVVFA